MIYQSIYVFILVLIKLKPNQMQTENKLYQSETTSKRITNNFICLKFL